MVGGNPVTSQPDEYVASAPTVAAPAWLAVASLAISTFASVTTEFLPVGLLSNIATSLHVSEGEAGLMVTMPGLVAAITGPVLIVASGRLNRRRLLLSLSMLLVASNLVAALAQNLPTMLLARVLLGLVVGGFWTFAPGATAYMVPPALQPRAISYVLAGISVATVAGIPAGALLGNLAGWRVAFLVSAALAAVVLALQLLALPSMPAARAVRPRELLAPLSNRASRIVLIISMFLVAGHFAGYTYLGPALQQVFGMSPEGVTTLLLVYGGTGFLGTFAGGPLVVRSPRWTALAATIMISIVLLLSAISGKSTLAGSLAVVVWGAAFGLVPVAMTTWMQEASPDAPEAGQALLVTFIQTALATGALIGGLAVDARGVGSSLLLGGVLTLIAAIVIAAAGGRRR